MLKQLIGSRTRISIFKFFVFNPKAEYYTREIERAIKEPFDPMRRELIRLESIGLLKSRISGRQKYYSVNTGYPILPEIKSIIFKTIGLGDALRDLAKDRNDIEVAFIYGSYAKDTENLESDVDLFILGNIASKDLQQMISKLEKEVKREINPVVYSAGEFKEKVKAKNHFLISLIKEPKIFLKGDGDVFRGLASGG